MIKTWQQRCEDHEGIVTNQMILDRMQEEIDELRQALAQPEQETFTLDRGCYERGCVAYDERDGDCVTINVDANSGKFDPIEKRDSSSWVGLTKEKNFCG